jgi:tetratricopeptide (TPR) repeat protein
MPSLDDLVNKLISEHEATKPDVVAGKAAEPSAGVKVEDSFGELIKTAAARAEEEERLAELKSLREETQRMAAELSALRAENEQLKQSGGGNAPSSESNAVSSLSGASGGAIASGNFAWKKHISTVESAIRAKDVKVAEPIIKVLIDIAEVVTTEPAVRVRLLTQLGTITLEQGNIAEAEETLKKGIEVVKSVQSRTSADNIALSFCLDALAQCSQEREDFEQAEKLRRQAVVLSEEALGAEHPDASYFRERLELMRSARQLANIGNDEGSKTVLDKLTAAYNAKVAAGESVELPEEKPADSYSGFMFDKFMTMAKTSIQQKNMMEAENNLRSAVQKMDGMANSDPRKCEGMRMLAQVLQATKKENESKELYERALTHAFHYIGWNDIQVAHCLAALADIHGAQSDFGTAKNYYKQALTVYKNVLGNDDEQTRTAQTKYDEFIERLQSEAQWKGWSQ